MKKIIALLLTSLEHPSIKTNEFVSNIVFK